jgi:ectoine hydroxylase
MSASKASFPLTCMAELQRVTAEFQEASKAVAASATSSTWAPAPSADHAVLRRLKSPDIRHDAYWRFATGLMADVAADLVGPDVVFHHSKLNFKWFDASDTVKWHQDIQFFPHTNYNVLTIGCYLADTDMTNGPLAALKRSHDDPLYDQYDADGNWTGMLSDAGRGGGRRLPQGRLPDRPRRLDHHPQRRTLHYSPSSKSPTPRPAAAELLFLGRRQGLHAASRPLAHAYEIVRGEDCRWAEHDPRPCQIPPDWSGGYTSIFAAQSGEDKSAASGGMM